MSETQDINEDIWNDGISDSDLQDLDFNDSESGESSSKKPKLDSQKIKEKDKRKGKKVKAVKVIKVQTDYSPLKKYRGKYLWVTDFTQQLWCEQQLMYTYEVPAVVVENPRTKIGKAIHLARELEVHDLKTVEVTSDEDVFAVRAANLLDGMKELVLGAPCIREIPIFGMPFDCEIFIIGKIDEIRCDFKEFQFDLVELKTRTSRSLPGPAIEKSHRFQVMLYKKLLDDIVLQKLTKEVIATKLSLDLDKELGKDVIKSCNCKNISNLGQLLDELFMIAQSLTVINQMIIEYVYQDDGQVISLKNIEHDSEWFKDKYQHLSNFWEGKRNQEGVEIEEAWKCNSCTYQDICEWRTKKSAECIKRNEISSPIKKSSV